jgi:hypothetical protein
MSSQGDTATEEALLMELAQLGMGMSRQLHQAALATTDTERLVALATAFHNVGRGVRQSLALRARFVAGTVVTERTARPEASSAPPRPDVERHDWNEHERPDWNVPVEALRDADESLDADPDVCRARIRRDLTVVSRTPALAAIPALRAPAAALAGRAALLGAASLRLVDSS